MIEFQNRYFNFLFKPKILLYSQILWWHRNLPLRETELTDSLATVPLGPPKPHSTEDAPSQWLR